MTKGKVSTEAKQSKATEQAEATTKLPRKISLVRYGRPASLQISN